jgi:hypothetical protein
MKERRFWQGERYEKWLKRELFFDEITRRAYHVNESLRFKVYVPYQSIIPGYNPRFEELDDLAIAHFRKTHPDSTWSDYEHFHTWEAYMMADDEHYPELIPIREAVREWSDEYHLNADWCREVAVRTLGDWARADRHPKYKDDEEPSIYDWICYGGDRYHVHPLEGKVTPLPGFPPYLPFRHKSLDHYLKEVRRWVADQIIPQSIWHKLKDSWICSDSDVGRKIIDKYIELNTVGICEIASLYAGMLENFYIKKGFPPLHSRPEEGKHFRWAVQAQINEKTFSSIAKSANLYNSGMPNTSYVRREVLKVLSDIDLPSRPELLKPGRPRRTNNEKTRHRTYKR